MQTAKEYLANRLEQLRTERSSWIPHWRDLNENFSPRRGKFLMTDRNKGQRRNNLVNNTGLRAARILRSGMMTGSTNPARPWKRLTTVDQDMAEDAAVKGWLEQVNKKIDRVFAASNLYKMLPLVYEDAGVIGTAALLHEEDFETISRFTTLSAGEYMLDTDDRGRVNTFAREYQATVYQVVSKFGLKNCSQQVQDFYNRGDYSTWVDIGHLIEPASIDSYDIPRLPEKFKYRSVYWELGRDELAPQFLQVKGYHEFPVHAPRWDTKTGDVYGSSAGMDALGDAKALQIQEREKAKAIAKMSNPPVNVPAGLQNMPLSLIPGGANFTDNKEGIRAAYQVNSRIDHLTADIQLTEQRINEAFYVDLFLMISNMPGIQPRNEAEIAERQEEKLLQLGPVLENMHDDLLKPLIDRQFNQLVRLSEPGWNGMDDKYIIPPPPEQLQGSELKVEFVSTLAQAQKQVALGGIERWVAFVGGMSQYNADVLDKMDMDEIAETYGEDLGVPADTIVSDDEVEEIRGKRAQQQAQMQQMEAGLAAVEGMKTGAEVMKTARESI